MIRLIDHHTGEVVEVAQARHMHSLFGWVATSARYHGPRWARRLKVEATDRRVESWVWEELRRKYPSVLERHEWRPVVIKRFKCSQCKRLIFDKKEDILYPVTAPDMDTRRWEGRPYPIEGVCDTCILHLHDSYLAPLNHDWDITNTWGKYLP